MPTTSPFDQQQGHVLMPKGGLTMNWDNAGAAELAFAQWPAVRSSRPTLQRVQQSGEISADSPGVRHSALSNGQDGRRDMLLEQRNEFSLMACGASVHLHVGRD